MGEGKEACPPPSQLHHSRFSPDDEVIPPGPLAESGMPVRAPDEEEGPGGVILELPTPFRKSSEPAAQTKGLDDLIERIPHITVL